MTRYSPFTWADDPVGATPITAARLNALEAGADADVPVADIDATGTADATTFLRGDGTWATPAGGSGAVDSVNGATGAVVLDQDNVLDGTTYKQYSATEKTKLAGIASGATANSSDATLLDRANHTGTQAASTIGSGTMATARLGSGTADATTFLRGDQTWATVSGSGATDLDDLTDVTIASVSDNQMLQYDSGTSQWKNEAIPLMVVDAGSNLSTARPAGATVVYWMFDFGTDPGTDGANVVNGVDGDLYYVAGA